MKRWIRRDHPRTPAPRASQGGCDETREAMRTASGARADALRRDSEVKEVSTRLREIRQQNHFGELLTQVLKEGRKL